MEIFHNISKNQNLRCNRMKNVYILLILIIVSQIFMGCSRRIYEVAYPTLNDGKYDSEFPYKSSSAELKQITKTVHKLNSIAYYQSFTFSFESQVTRSDIVQDSYQSRALEEIFYNNSVIGTGTIIYSSNRQLALLTCAHVIDFEDTLITYYKDKYNQNTVYVQSVAFKQRQNNFVAELPEKGTLEILSMDETLDIALLGKTFKSTDPPKIPNFQYLLGNAKELKWGSFVYLVGYPKGYKMITKGIVSQPNRDSEGAFLVDAQFNRGFSGGIVLAIRDGVPNFELVGMASSVSADFEYFLTPPEDFARLGYDPRIPYKGEAFIKFKKDINYGITFIVSSESILNFIKENQQTFLDKGYDLSSTF